MSMKNYFRKVLENRPSEDLDVCFFRMILRMLSWVYGLGVWTHRMMYRSGISKPIGFVQPVISIGNLTWGGTGKTPFVAYLSNYFLRGGKVPLILARGYGSDENKELKENLKQAKLGIGADRVRQAKAILKNERADVMILDDGFQHWKIRRDLDVVLINMLNPFGNGFLIPRGSLREPLSALRRASLIVLTDSDLVSRKDIETVRAKIRKVNPDASFVLAGREPVYFYRAKTGRRFTPDYLEGKRISVFTGIGTPRSFLKMLNRMGVKAICHFEFGDHHRFKNSELREILKMKSTHEIAEVVTTEKDFFRCRDSITEILNPLILKARFRLLEGEAALYDRLERLTEKRGNAMSNSPQDSAGVSDV